MLGLQMLQSVAVDELGMFPSLPKYENIYSNEGKQWPNGKRSVKHLRTSSDWHLYSFQFHLSLPVRERTRRQYRTKVGRGVVALAEVQVFCLHTDYDNTSNSGRASYLQKPDNSIRPCSFKRLQRPPFHPQLEADLNGLNEYEKLR